jgi:hypothetical protein
MCLRKYGFFLDSESRLLSLLTCWKPKSLNRTDTCKNKAGSPIVAFRLNFAIYSGIREVKLNATLNVDKAYEEYNRMCILMYVCGLF